MIYCDNIIENGSIFLRNLDLNSSTTWATKDPGTYNCYDIDYETPLVNERLYFYRVYYKYTTTNQSPTWVRLYSQVGTVPCWGDYCAVNNPVANTEYVLYGFGYGKSIASNGYGSVYNGDNGVINGVVGHVKNSMVYDVTELYTILKSNGVVSNEHQLSDWCNTNLSYKAPGVDYDISSLLNDVTKTVVSKGNIVSEVVECDGMEYYSCTNIVRSHTYFDEGEGVYIYNNNDNGAVTFTRISAEGHDSPFYPEHKHILKITTNGSASPDCGGFVAEHYPEPNKIYIEKFVAKIPVGYLITAAFNPQGDGAVVDYFSNREGTGEWEEYAILYKCGATGEFSSGGYVYLEPTNGASVTSVTWYLAYVNNCDITHDENLKNFSVLPKKDVIKGDKVFSYKFNTTNLIPNGRLEDGDMELPEGTYFDENDYAGNSLRSIVQPVGGRKLDGVFGKLRVNPQTKYKLSYWVKCKGDMSSFLTAIVPYTVDDVELYHGNTHYIYGTDTTLTAPLNKGDMQMQVSLNVNWIVRDYSKVGFREWNNGWNKFGTFEPPVVSDSVVAGTYGNNVVLFSTPYTGETMPVGRYVVESYDGAKWKYPIAIYKLPTDNTWKYVEGYFGGEEFSGSWDGMVINDNSWPCLPKNTDYIKLALNIYRNDGSVPIKFCDIKIEEVGTVMGDGSRNENKIQFIKHN